MRPRIAEAESDRSFLGGDFCRGFDGRAEWITERLGILAVGVIDAPQFVFGGRCQIHAAIESQTAPVVVPLRHIRLRLIATMNCDGGCYELSP